MFKNQLLSLVVSSSLLSFIFFVPQTGHAASLRFVPSATSDKGEVQFVLAVDQVTKLAGLKVTITYDDKKIRFIKADKAIATSSFLHVVNAKKKGQLIIVMASAKGISGENIELLTADFTLSQKDMIAGAKLMTISQCQLMSESLKEITCSFLKK